MASAGRRQPVTETRGTRQHEYLQATTYQRSYNFKCYKSNRYINALLAQSCTHTYARTHIHTHTYIHTYTHTYIHTYIHTHIHTYIHTHTHVHVRWLYKIHAHVMAYLK